MALRQKTEFMRLRFEKCLNSNVYREPLQKVNDYYMQIDKYIKSMENSSIKKLKDSKLEATKLITKLDTLSPLKTLTRGYSVVSYENGDVVTKAKDLKKDMEINVRFQDGTAKAKVI